MFRYTKEKTIYFKNGRMFKVKPNNVDSYYDARILVTDGKYFDLENSDDLEKIPIPNFAHLQCTFEDATKSLDYVLRMKAGHLYNLGKFNECFSCLRKANELMANSNMRWHKKDYFRVIYWLIEQGRFDEAEREEIFIEEHYKSKYDFDILHEHYVKKILLNCSELGTDLLESSNVQNCSEECAVYRRRIFSISGKDSRFPKFSKEVIKSGITLYPFIEGVSSPIYGTWEELILSSNRPFQDDRSQSEKDAYNAWLSEIKEERKRDIDRVEYYKIFYMLPNMSPKSFGAYRKMKKNRTRNFLLLKKLAEEAGINIEL